MLNTVRSSLLLALAACITVPAFSSAPPPPMVTVNRDSSGRWQIFRDGQPFPVKGVGGYRHLDMAASLGANTIRTWGVEMLDLEEDGKPLIDRAHELGLSIVAGIWLSHEGPGSSYDDPVFLQAQRDKVRAAVRRHRDHPAILIWGLGNEMEGPTSRAHEPRIWRELEILARLIKEEDPRRPIVTVLAGAAVEKIRAFREHCPSIDILGINAYGYAPLVTHSLDAAGWTGPFMLTEFGPRGQWEIVHTSWGVPVEPRSVEKVAYYVGAHRSALADPGRRCVGTFCFIWGQKQEVTATWYGMFLATGEKTPVVDAMAYELSGRWPANLSPQIYNLRVPFGLDRVPAGKEYTVTASVHDPEGDPLSYEWMVVAESTDRRYGGAYEKVPPSLPECTVRADGATAVIRTPSKPGPYRLFLYVRDGKGGGATENVPFFVQ